MKNYKTIPKVPPAPIQNIGAISLCRACRHPSLETVLDLGQIALAEVLLKEEDLGQTEDTYPLRLVFCSECGLAQLAHTLPPEILYSGDYPYYSSVSQTLLDHFGASARHLIENRKLDASSFVMDIASNDGYMLKTFVEKGIPVLGVDPAKGPAEAAAKAGVPTLCDFYSESLARKLHDEGKRANVILANNVLNLVDDLPGFAEGLRILLKEDGVAVIEVPYIRELADTGAFDSIFHQHLSYFSVTALDRLFRQSSLFLNRVERISTFGGSVRIYVEKQDKPDPSVQQILSEERELAVDKASYYRDFAARAEKIRQSIKSLLRRCKEEGKTVAVFGAGGGRATTLLGYIGLGSEDLAYAIDSNTHKQGFHTPGSRLPIVPPAELLRRKPDYVLLSAWNYSEEILRQHQGYTDQGGRFIIPIPETRVVPAEEERERGLGTKIVATKAWLFAHSQEFMEFPLQCLSEHPNLFA